MSGAIAKLPPVAESTHAVLRRETAGWHRAVEDAFAPLDLTRRADLALFLRAQARAVFAIEAELERREIGRLVPDWPVRRRSDALKSDLQRLEGASPVLAAPRVCLAKSGHQLGALYVLEGSRLGGRMLARRVAASPHPQVACITAFLSHKVTPGAWAEFLRILNETREPVTDMVQGAIEAFRLYHAAATTVGDQPLVPRPGA